MNDKLRDAEPSEFADTGEPVCQRAFDMVSHLYGEATEEEAEKFGAHLNACASCRDEMASFEDVRGALGAWRREAFSLSPSLAPNPSLSNAQTALTAKAGRRSAAAALREFFSLSPRWLQMASAAAMLLLCALAALTLSRSEVRWDQQGIALRAVRERVVERRVEVPVAPGGSGFVSPEQVSELVSVHERELETLRSQLKQQTETDRLPAVTTSSGRKSGTPTILSARSSARRTPRNAIARARAAERDVAEVADDELPRLYDLLRDVN